MRENGLKARPRRRFKRTTDSGHKHPVAPNVLKQDFTTDRPNEVWVGDITYLWTLEGWAYLAVLIDLFELNERTSIQRPLMRVGARSNPRISSVSRRLRGCETTWHDCTATDGYGSQ